MIRIRVRSSLGQIVALQAAAEPTGLDPDHRVGHGVEAWISVEDINRDGIGFDPVSAPGKGLLHDELQEAPLPFGVHEIPAGDDALKRILDELWRDRFVDIVGHGLCLSVGRAQIEADGAGGF